MRPNFSNPFLPTLLLCAAPVITFTSASAEVMSFNEANATNVWTLPTGTNLLNGATAVPATANTHEGSSASWTALTDGVLGTPGTNAATVTPSNGDSVTFPLDIVAKPAGYDITTFDSYVTWENSGRTNQNFTLQYSTVGDPTTFNNIATVANGDSGADKATHVSLTDTTGVLASGVHSLRLVFDGQENGYVGFSELKALATPTNVSTLIEANNGNAWTLPSGANLLNGANANPPNTNSNEGSSADWSTVTNGQLGAADSIPSSVTPPNNSSVVFPLDLSVNFNGYNLSSIDTYCSWPNSGRDNSDISISYSTVAAPETFIKLGNAVVHTGEPLNATHARLTPVSGFLASGVAAIRFDFGHQENGYVGYREFIAQGSPVSLSDPITWTGSSGSGGNANWISGSDNNWKKTVGGAATTFNPQATATFDATAANRNINIPTGLTASALVFSNSASTPYTFGGQLLTVSNDVLSSGAGSATFNNAVNAVTGVTLSGSGNLAFNGALQSNGLTVSGSGNITLNAANPALTGNASVSSGTLTVSNNNGAQNAKLVVTGGAVRFTSAAPQVASIAGAFGSSIVLGNSSGSVNTKLSVGDVDSVSNFAGSISNAAGATGSLTKTGTSTLVLSGANTYTGTTTVNGGLLKFDQRLALYNGNTAAWTASNIVVANGGTLGLKVGDEFTDTDVNTALSLGGFQAGSALGIFNELDFTLSRNLTQPGIGLLKAGPGLLNLTGNNTSNGLYRIVDGGINAASTSSTAIGGSVLMGNAVAHVYLNFAGSNQFGSGSVLGFANGSFYQSKVNLRGTNQTVAGLDGEPFPANRVSLIQNDEVGQIGYTTNPGPATLTINAATDHSFYGLIRNQDGDPVSVVKTGPGTQEFVNMATVQGFGYSGPTTINEGRLKLNFNGGNSGYASNVTVNSPGVFQLEGVFNFFRTISGNGGLVKTGSGLISVANVDGLANVNTFSGGTVIEEGTLKFFAAGPSTADGNAPGQFCAAGPMDPSNIIRVKAGARLGVGGVAPLGQSPVLPQFAPTIVVEPGGGIWGSEGNDISFVPNIHLDGGTVDVTNGSDTGGFHINMAFVGTVVVGGTSNTPSTVSTSGTGANASVGLGSLGLLGTTFQVADVTASADADLVVSSNLKDVLGNPSPLIKTGPGTMQLIGAKEYTGATTVSEGVLQLDTATLADRASVSIAAAGTLNLQHSNTDIVGGLSLGGVQMAAGIYGATTNSTPGIIKTPRITGTGLLDVRPGLTYDAWAAAIPNPADRDRGDDPDSDGFTNLEEFLFGTSPTAASGSLSTIEKTEAGLVVHWNQLATGSSIYVLQESTSLLDNPWATSGATITDAPVQDLPDYVRKQAVLPVTGIRKFVRVQATE
ncbi:autotransporter-associated beta strand repeat-containing protein [Haloferula sp. BvORR071]|uniref:beta strand repeat-containing protein n=1 Tax=Haloferula sp. BvORR071 TaxID=1396141 RepID=UPI000551768E|nr:autotransporter-associated beta strand repeat-containing protein [Haloferula sp. BvORR071]